MAKIRLAIGLFLLLSLLVLISPLTPAVADPDEIIWSRVNIPTEGKVGNWVLAKGSAVAHLTTAIDGTLYAYVTGLTYTLYKSTDEGRSWSYTGNITDAIVDIATAPNNANTLYYATSSDVYKSTDAGSSFTPLPPNPGGAGSNHIEITAIDVATLGSHNIIAVGTKDIDGSQYGGVYTLDENEISPGWVDTNIGSYDVYATAFSPNFTTGRQLVAVGTDEKDTFVTTRIGDADWGKTVGDAKLDKDNSGIPTPVAVVNSAAIAFPSDYDPNITSGHYVLFVAIDAGGNNGDVYRINGVAAPNSSSATDLDIGSAYSLSNIDVTTLAISGNAASAKLLAGATGSAQIYLSTNGGSNWVKSAKEPTGDSRTCVLMASDFTSNGKAYAATSGIESAFSYTIDGGATWNQLSLINTEISNIADLAPSPSYSQNNTLFMLTLGSEYSLWRSLNGGANWERVFATTLANVDSTNLVKLSPQYGNVSQVVFLAGISNGNPAIWKSTDNGQNFTCRSAPFSIDTWAVVDDNTLFVGSFDAISNRELIYSTTDSGSTYSSPVVVSNHPLNSIAFSPNYKQDKTILIGSTDGWVYRSNDNGTSFEPLPPDATSAPLTGNISVAFDPRFSSNSTVYAASDTPDSDIYRFIIGKSNKWQGIDSTLPAGGTLGQLRVSADGTLYAANSQLVDTATKKGGVERCLNPSYSLGPTFETVTLGLDDNASLAGLWLSGKKLWSVDTANTRLMTFTDSLAVPVILISPPDQASGIDTRNITLEWNPASGATKYEWQLDYNTDFSSPPSEGDTQANSVRLTKQLELATTYYWRVRVTEPLLSPWSAIGSFTTSLGSSVIAPDLRIPGAGAKNVELRPIFQWSALAGAESYELLVATDVSFTNPVIKRTLPATAWQSDISLDYDTTYYWKVRARGLSSYSAWSDVSAFITKSSPAIESSPGLPLPSSSESSSSSPSPELYSPQAGVSGVPLRPIFQWSTVDGAESYELLVSADASFTNPIIIKIGAYALPATAWQSDISLDYDTTYYWKVRARGLSSYSAWSDVSAFITEPSPELTLPSSAESSSSSPSPELIIPDWVKYLAIALFLTMLAILITMIILTVKVLRL